jgi:5-formyltetrahydrofolate cyclo-ligase
MLTWIPAFAGKTIRAQPGGAFRANDEEQIASLTVTMTYCSTPVMAGHFADKSAARQWVWDRLAAEGVARFPFPPHGRIPNFAGAKEAAARLLDTEPWKSAGAIKVNPDSPQRPLRAGALRRGITVFVPTPRLRGGFKKLDPRRIPPDKFEEAAGLSHGDRWSEEVALADMPRLDAIVCGSVAVTRDGRRCGKGEGYSDLEFAILRELGHPPVPVATTVHDLQIVDSVPRDPTDQPLSVIATPAQTIRIRRPGGAPTGIDWTRLSAEDLEEMPILAELKRMLSSNA